MLELLGAAPLQAGGMDPLLEQPPLVRGLAGVLVIAGLGTAIRWRFGGFLDRAITASTDRPVAALAYGVAANAVLAFAGFYLTTQLGASAVGQAGGTVGFVTGAALLVAAGGVGFTVVGTAIVGLVAADRRSLGPVVGGLLAALAVALDPLSGGVLWFILVSMGIGGPARRWLHADAYSTQPTP